MVIIKLFSKTNIETEGFYFNEQSTEKSFNNTKLHYLIANECILEAEQTLIAANMCHITIDLTLTDTFGCTPLLLAAKTGKEAFTLKLIESTFFDAFS